MFPILSNENNLNKSFFKANTKNKHKWKKVLKIVGLGQEKMPIFKTAQQISPKSTQFLCADHQLDGEVTRCGWRSPRTCTGHQWGSYSLSIFSIKNDNFFSFLDP